MVQKKRNAQLKKINSAPANRQEPMEQEQQLPAFKLKDWFENNRQIVQSPVVKEEGETALGKENPQQAFHTPSDDLYRQSESFSLDRPDLAQLLYNLSRAAQPNGTIARDPQQTQEYQPVDNDPNQLLHNHSFELWEDVQSPVSWKSKGVSREDNPTNVQKGHAALHMPADSSIYQFIYNGLKPNAIYQITFFARVGNRSLNVPLVASVSFYSALGDQIGYETKIIVDATIVETTYKAFKIITEVPAGTQTARLNLAVPASNSEDLGNYYIIDEVTFNKVN